MDNAIRDIREWYRQRADLIRAEGNLTRVIKSATRRYMKSTIARNLGQEAVKNKMTDADFKRLLGDEEYERVNAQIAPVLVVYKVARDPVHKEKLRIERALKKAVRELPAFAFVEQTKGFGDIAFSMIVGEAGDLSNYSCPSKLWKRMGLACINGEAQRKVTDKDKAELFGYNPQRRSVMHVIGESLIKQGDTYKTLYNEFKAREQEKVPDARPIVHHRRAMRKMEKRLLRDLWEFWVDHIACDNQPATSRPELPQYRYVPTNEVIHVSAS